MNTPVTITDEMLARVGACDEAREAMRTAFPDGMPLTREALQVAIAHKDGSYWACWLLSSPLTPKAARAEHLRIRDAAWAEYLRTKDATWAECCRVESAAVVDILIRWGAGEFGEPTP